MLMHSLLRINVYNVLKKKLNGNKQKYEKIITKEKKCILFESSFNILRELMKKT